mmetsp:Transcript_24059/g.45719  ORF Transcript_24059/g.45719 Transcript_24059/m.45719 type:complete len:324 (-) Transcript_24059:174-1145(-)
MPTLATLTSFLLLVTETPLLIGLANYVAPDYFFDPKGGALAQVTHIRKTSLDTNHIDAINRVIMMACGAVMLSIVAMQLLSRDVISKRALMRIKLYLAIIQSVVFLKTAVTMNDEESMLSPKIISFAAGLQVANTLWLASETIHFYRRKSDNIRRTPARTAHLLLLGFTFAYLLGWSVIKLFYPEALVQPLAFWNKTLAEDEKTLDELSVFSSKIEGSYLLAFALGVLDVLLLDRSLERTRWNNLFTIVVIGLYAPVFARAAMDDSGTINRTNFIKLNLTNFMVAAFTLRYTPKLLPHPMPQQVAEPPKTPEPTLVEETDKTK